MYLSLQTRPMLAAANGLTRVSTGATLPFGGAAPFSFRRRRRAPGVASLIAHRSDFAARWPDSKLTVLPKPRYARSGQDG